MDQITLQANKIAHVLYVNSLLKDKEDFAEAVKVLVQDRRWVIDLEDEVEARVERRLENVKEGDEA